LLNTADSIDNRDVTIIYADRLAPGSTQVFAVLSQCTKEKAVLIQLILVTSVSYLF